MSESEKMLAGKIYDPFAEGLPEERTMAHVLCRMYNETTEVDSEKEKRFSQNLCPTVPTEYIFRDRYILTSEKT